MIEVLMVNCGALLNYPFLVGVMYWLCILAGILNTIMLSHPAIGSHPTNSIIAHAAIAAASIILFR